jgi:hypothetical protein
MVSTRFQRRWAAESWQSCSNILFWVLLEWVHLKTQKTCFRVASHICFACKSETITFIKCLLQSNPFRSIELLIGYNFIVNCWKSSFHKTFLENFTGYLLEKNSSVYVKIWERYFQNTERLIHSGTLVILSFCFEIVKLEISFSSFYRCTIK